MRLIVSKEEHAPAANAVGILVKVISAFEQGHQYKTDDKETKMIADFVNSMEISVGTSGELDTVLMGEIGKAYQSQYLQAQETGDKEAEARFYGAMFATKKIMDMLKEPEY